MSECKEELNKLQKYKEFYKTATQGIEVVEPTPDLLQVVKKIPTMYKESIVEYLDYCSKELITKWLDVAENEKSILFLNGMRVMANQLIKKVLDIVEKEEQWYTLISRQPLKQKTWLKKVKKSLDK